MKYRIIESCYDGEVEYTAQYYEENKWHNIDKGVNLESLKEKCRDHAAEYSPKVVWVEIL